MDSGNVLTLATLAYSGREGVAACVDQSALPTRRSEDPMGLDRVHPCGDIADRLGNCPTFKSEPMAKRPVGPHGHGNLRRRRATRSPAKRIETAAGSPLSRRVQAAAARRLRLACAAS